MRSSPLHPTRWRARLLQHGRLATPRAKSGTPAVAGASPACRLTDNTSAAATARDCRRSDGRAAVVQMRPLSVVSRAAGSSPFGRSSCGRSGRL